MTSKANSNGYMLDTDVFNHVADEKIPIEQFRGARIFATHAQIDELRQAKAERAAELIPKGPFGDQQKIRPALPVADAAK
jgi:hypothetical protein